MPRVYVNTFGQLYFNGTRYDIPSAAGLIITAKASTYQEGRIRIRLNGCSSYIEPDPSFQPWRIPEPHYLGFYFPGDIVVTNTNPTVAPADHGRQFTVIDWDGNLLEVMDKKLKRRRHFHGYNVSLWKHAKLDPLEGWGLPFTAIKSHYFVGRDSLCGKWQCGGPLIRQLAGNTDVQRCTACLNLLTLGAPPRKAR